MDLTVLKRCDRERSHFRVPIRTRHNLSGCLPVTATRMVHSTWVEVDIPLVRESEALKEIVEIVLLPGTIRLEARQRASSIRPRRHDKGHDQIFAKFAADQYGAGLCLAVLKAIIHKHVVRSIGQD